MAREEPPAYVVHESDVPEEEGAYPAPFDVEKLSYFRALGRTAGARSLGLNLERIPPGRRTSFTHAHSHEEELIYVVRGTCAVRTIDPGGVAVETPLRAGHVIAFPAGTGVAHTFVNRGTEDCTLLCVGDRHEGVDRVFYPEDAAFDRQHAEQRPTRHWTLDAPSGPKGPSST